MTYLFGFGGGVVRQLKSIEVELANFPFQYSIIN